MLWTCLLIVLSDFLTVIPNFGLLVSQRKRRNPSQVLLSSLPASSHLLTFNRMDSPTPTLPDTLGASTGDSISILPNTIRADTPRPSETDNMSPSVDSVGDAAQQNELIADQLLTLSKLTASLLNQKLSPLQTTLVEASLSAMLSAVGGESKDKPVDLATSPSSSDQDKSSCNPR